MILSPQSSDVIERLERGETVEAEGVRIGPLDETARTLLRLLVDQYEALESPTGKDQARALREAYLERKNAQAQQAPDASDAADRHGAPEAVTSETGTSLEDGHTETTTGTARPPGWRLVELECTSIRGVAPPGQTFRFSFRGLSDRGVSNLIFGPNGSGKSSLLGAVVWVLTGTCPSDAADHQDAAVLHRAATGTAKGARICDWPVAATLPDEPDPTTASPQSRARIELQSFDCTTTLHLRRTIEGGLEHSSDASGWAPCSGLSEHGITPLDLQLSILAPSVFGAQGLERAPNTRSLLSLMLGFDDLEKLGQLAGNLGRNRTSLVNAEKEQLESAWDRLGTSLLRLPGMLSERSPVREALTALGPPPPPDLQQLKKTHQAISDAVTAAESSLAELLELPDEGAPRPDLADKLTASLAALERGIWDSFDSLASLRLERMLPGSEELSPADRLNELETGLRAFVPRVIERMQKRLAWWRREASAGRRAGLLLRAASEYDPQLRQCPVCKRSVKGMAVETELRDLSGADPELLKETEDFFRALCEEIEGLLPDELRTWEAVSPHDAIMRDWQKLCDTVMGPELRPLSSGFDESIKRIASGIAMPEVHVPQVLPDEAEDEFAAFAAEFLADLASAFDIVALLRWSERNIADVGSRLHKLVTAPSSEHASSLLALLSRGKEAAANLRPLEVVRDELQQACTDRREIAETQRGVQILDELQPALEALKPLSRYAAGQVVSVFAHIVDRSLANLKQLYPESPSGLELTRLVMSTGRDTTVEALLSRGDYEVQSQFFANAGLQRAIALSFYCALLDDHPGGLGFVTMDDPILSLDDDHRESWSANILRPRVDSVQFVLATHQRQFLNNCRHDFATGRVVELNPRSRAGRITWRPGDRLDRAEEELGRAPTNAPNELRKYREELLLTLDSYSPRPFFDESNLKQSFLDYGQLAPPHPLAGRGQRRIVAMLSDPKVTHVLDPGSHALTEADVTPAMSKTCLSRLRDLNGALNSELERLERLRRHEQRRRVIPASLVPFRGVPECATWSAPIEIAELGRAAARPNGLVVDVVEEPRSVLIPPGSGALVACDVLEPIALRGQWLILAPDEVPPQDGDLIVAVDTTGRRLLRRAWSEGEDWLLESVNPIRPVASILAPKREAAIRKVIGVLFEPAAIPSGSSGPILMEWQPRNDFPVQALRGLRAVTVEGDSLAPIALAGQEALVAAREDIRVSKIDEGALAVVETDDESIGNVIKRVFLRSDHWVLTSPNPVQRYSPDVVSVDRITAVWPLRGVLFETLEACG